MLCMVSAFLISNLGEQLPDEKNYLCSMAFFHYAFLLLSVGVWDFD